LAKDGKIRIQTTPHKISTDGRGSQDTNMNFTNAGSTPLKLVDSNKENNPNGNIANTGNVGNGRERPVPSRSLSSKSDKVLCVEPLDNDDIEFLTERFELAGFIHYGHFLDYFENTYIRFIRYQKQFKYLPEETSHLSPFTYSSEWNALKASSILLNNKDQIRSSRKSVDRSLVEPKSFTAPKSLPPSKPPRPTSTPTPIVDAEPKQEVPPPKEITKEVVVDEKKSEPPEDKKPSPPPPTPAPEPSKSAPVVEQSSCFLCSLGARQPTPTSQPKDLLSPIADAKSSKDETPAHKRVTIDTPDAKKVVRLDSDDHGAKFDLPPIKRSNSPPGFHVPRGFDADSTSSEEAHLHHREGLGKSNIDDTPVMESKTKGSRFRRRDGKDFNNEKTVQEEAEELEEDERYGGRK
jgi:hypothetical protein